MHYLPIRKFSLPLHPVYHLPRLFYYVDNPIFPSRSLTVGAFCHLQFTFCHSSPCSPHSRPSDVLVVSRICQAVPPLLLPTLSRLACAWPALALPSVSASRMWPPWSRHAEPSATPESSPCTAPELQRSQAVHVLTWCPSLLEWKEAP